MGRAFCGIDLVLDNDDKTWVSAHEQQVNAMPFTKHPNVAQIDRPEVDAGKGSVLRCAFTEVNQKGLQEKLSLSMRFSRMEQPREKVGMTSLGTFDSESAEYVELTFTSHGDPAFRP